MKKKLIIPTIAITMMFGFNKFAFADTLNNNINNTSEQQMTYSTGYINATRVNFRTEPSTDSEVYSLLDEGTDVIILGQEGDWTKVDIDDTIGYVYGKYITNHKNDINVDNIDENNVTSLDVTATAYAGYTITSTGTVPVAGSTIAVDPDVIPYGSKVYIPEFNKVFTAEDCGSAIKGNRIDIFMNSEAECNNWGVQDITVYILN